MKKLIIILLIFFAIFTFIRTFDKDTFDSIKSSLKAPASDTSDNEKIDVLSAEVTLPVDILH